MSCSLTSHTLHAIVRIDFKTHFMADIMCICSTHAQLTRYVVRTFLTHTRSHARCSRAGGGRETAPQHPLSPPRHRETRQGQPPLPSLEAYERRCFRVCSGTSRVHAPERGDWSGSAQEQSPFTFHFALPPQRSTHVGLARSHVARSHSPVLHLCLGSTHARCLALQTHARIVIIMIRTRRRGWRRWRTARGSCGRREKGARRR